MCVRIPFAADYGILNPTFLFGQMSPQRIWQELTSIVGTTVRLSDKVCIAVTGNGDSW